MAQWLKQSTAATLKFGPFIDDADGKTAETALSIAQADIRLAKAGGDFAQTNNATGATHDENGYYDVPLDTTDTNTLGRLRVAVSKSGALPVWQDFIVVSANVFDSLVGGTDTLDVDAQALLTLADSIESGVNLRDAHRVELAALGGLVSGAGTTSVTIQNRAGTKNRISATVDADGNRSAVTYDLT